MGIFFKLLLVARIIRDSVRGKKTFLSSISGILASGSAIVVLVISWSEQKINGQEFINQVQVPGAVFWASLTFLWSAFHASNVQAGK